MRNLAANIVDYLLGESEHCVCCGASYHSTENCPTKKAGAKKEDKCPRCGNEGYDAGKPGLKRCRHCKKHFSVSEHYEDFGDVPMCPYCGGEGRELGTLGNVHWARCRDCGMNFQVGEFDDRPAMRPRTTPPKAGAMPRPKADLMPGGSMGPVGDTTAIGISGGGN